MKIDAIRKQAMALPEVTEAPHFHLGAFRVRGRIFATVPPEATHLHLFVADDVRERALAMWPGCVENLFWGQRIGGLRMTLAKTRPAVARELLLAAWRNKAPKRLATALDAGTLA